MNPPVRRNAIKSDQKRILFPYQIECFCSDRIEMYRNRIKSLFLFDTIPFDLIGARNANRKERIKNGSLFFERMFRNRRGSLSTQVQVVRGPYRTGLIAAGFLFPKI
jgi:hypothetical protein